MIAAMVGSTALVPFGFTNVVTYALSVAAIVITSVVLIQGYRDTAAIHAKLDEIIVSMRAATRSSASSMNSPSALQPRSSGSNRKRTSKTELMEFDTDDPSVTPLRGRSAS